MVSTGCAVRVGTWVRGRTGTEFGSAGGEKDEEGASGPASSAADEDEVCCGSGEWVGRLGAASRRRTIGGALGASAGATGARQTWAWKRAARSRTVCGRCLRTRRACTSSVCEEKDPSPYGAIVC